MILDRMAADRFIRVNSVDPDDEATLRRSMALRAARATGSSLGEILRRSKAKEAPIPGDELPEGWRPALARNAKPDLNAFRTFLRRPGGEAPREGDEIPKIRKPAKRAKSR